MRRLSRGIWCLVLALAACSRKPASISVSPSPVKIYGLERSQRLTGRVLDRKGEAIPGGRSLTWSSSKAEVVTVDGSGRLVAKGQGKAMVTAGYQGLSTQVPVEVIDVREVAVSPPAAHVIGPPGTQVTLAAIVKDSKNKPAPLKVSWISSNPRVATVSAEGVVTSVAAGMTTVIAKVGDLQGASDVTVRLLQIVRLVIRPATALVRVGDSQHFEVVAFGPDGTAVEGVAAVFTSSDPAVATVDTAGVAVGVSPGISTIRATLAGVTAEGTLLVN